MIRNATLIRILKMTQREVKQYCKKQLKMQGYSPLLADGFLYAKGNLPVVLVAHMDTVFSPPKYIYDNHGILSGKKGLGADDRAGIYAILDLIGMGYRPHILLLEDEEIGCVGAKKFIDYGLDIDAKYIIELDRQGKNDAVFYDCYNDEFIDYVEGYGFKMDFGSYSDISIIAPHYNLSAVNLSVGYYDQHSTRETLILKELESTIHKVATMLDTMPDEIFSYFTKNSLTREKYGYVYKYRNTYNKKSDYKYSGSWESWSADDDYEYDYNKDTPPFEPDKDEDEQLEWYYNCDAKMLVILKDCLLNLPTKELIDLNYNTDYMIGDNNQVYHFEKGLMKDAIVLSYDFQELYFDDFNAKKSWESYQEDADTYYYNKGWGSSDY